MTSFLIVIFSLPSLLLALLLARRAQQLLGRDKHYNGVPRPPLVANWIPFLGNALEMAHGDAFWSKAHKRYGPVFRCLAMGYTRTFVTTPPLLNLVYKNSKSFDFLYFRKHLQNIIFGTDRQTAFSSNFEDRIFADHHKAMQPGVMADVIKRYADALEAEMAGRLEQLGDGQEVDLAETVYDILYTVSSKTFFSPSFPAAATKNPFIAFDKGIPILNLDNLPSLIRSSAVSAREKLVDQLGEWWSTMTNEDRKFLAPSVAVTMDNCESEGSSQRDQATILLTELWALEANAPYSGMWAIVEILRRPKLLASLRKEIDQATASLSPPSLSTLLHLPQPQLVSTLPEINATFQETLRYHMSTFSLRLIEKDTFLPASLCGNETGFSLKKGEELICLTRMNSIDKEGDWGTDADKWDSERFLDGNRKKGSMSPFGGGISMCEGRHFASAEILTTIASFIHLCDAELLPGGDTLQPDLKRVGMGVFHPTGHLKVRLRPRSTSSSGLR